MRIFSPAFLFLWFVMISIEGIAGTGAELESIKGKKGKGSSTVTVPITKKNSPSTPSMRIEEPDGTLRPLQQGTMPESYMSTEGLTEVPDAGGGKMVDVEGRFKSILVVPHGSDQAIHDHDSKDSSNLKK